MTTDLWKMAGEIAKLQTYKLFEGGEKLVELEEVLAIIRKYVVEANREVNDGK